MEHLPERYGVRQLPWAQEHEDQPGESHNTKSSHLVNDSRSVPDSKVHEANMGPIWGR